METKFPYILDTETFRDAETNQWIIYCERFELSSYGKSIDEATEMLNEIITDIILRSMTPEQPIETPFTFTSETGFTTTNSDKNLTP